MSRKYSGTKTAQRVDVGSLVPSQRNPQRHDTDQIDALVQSLITFGQPRPVLARAEDMVMIAGHGVLEAAKRAGWSTIDVLLWNVDQRTADLYMAADNQHGKLSTTDDAMVAQLIKDLEPENFQALGFMDEEVDDLLKMLDTKQRQVSVREVETTDVADTFWISVRGPLERQAEALQRIRTLMAEMPEVQVSQGTSELN